ncbi:MAG: Betaine aldehyde dehydrogenase [Candidatus Methanoperedenaceae archaeon GB50]|nr:MAG: Betaine aldehyde dehydrogenase [Candidatus Methanoperedenaceae archaeon GB50]
MIYAECFNPILLVKKFNQEEIEAIIAQNPTGLVLQIWSKDLKKAKALAENAQYGTVWINTFAQMDARTPFGGFKGKWLWKNIGQMGFI